MSWIPVALSAYLLLAIANLLDKFLVDNVIKNSRAYAFVACILGSIIFLVAPWFLEWPGWAYFGINLLNGSIFAIALWMLYEALRRGEASRILVFIGGITPVFSLFFSTLFFKEQFNYSQWLGIGALLVGVFIIAFLPTERSFLSRILQKLKFVQSEKTGGLWIALFSAFAYSVYFLGTKYAYAGQESFVSAFIWTRLGASLFVLLFLFNKKNRQAIAKLFTKSSPNNNKFLVIFNQGLGSIGFILQNYAVFLGSVVLVNALQGVQYAFLLVISAVLALMAPKLLKETFSFRIIIQKTAAVLVIALGFYFITI
ncbi:MAG: EamA family transporter [Patescibacteria group bacterium]|jgi:drug/metabolite transporter (DMT)-like permease